MAMTPYQRIFGTGPRGSLGSAATLALTFLLDKQFNLPPLHGNAVLGVTALAVGAVITALIVTWSLRALPPETRGRELITSGPFHYVRHPLYAAFLGPFDLGLALFLDGWIYLAWAALQYPIWHWNIAAEERLMRETFGDEYAEYCRRTGRFLPKLQTIAATLWD
jgi:protein-S-isoprenylcysteine O-methyltransferase Ste14